MNTTTVSDLLFPLPNCSSRAWRFQLPTGSAGRFAGDRAAEITKIVDAFLAEAGRASASQDLTIVAKSKRIAQTASTLWAEVAPQGPIGRAVDAVLAEIDGVRRAYDTKVDQAFDSIPHARIARGQQLAADLCANVLSTKEVEEFAAGLRSGDRDCVLAGLLVPATGSRASFRQAAERAFRVTLEGGQALLDSVEKAETIGTLLRLLSESARAGLDGYRTAVERGVVAVQMPDARVLLDLGNGLGPIEAKARQHGLLRAGTAANSGTFDRSFGGAAPRA